MIFKHLFRSKHQNPDPQVRLQAIENLNQEDSQQKSILHELAFNDSDVGVSLAALQKLDSFVLWYKMSQIAKNDRVQKKSQQFVENVLFDDKNLGLSVQDKRNFIIETRDIRLMEKLLGQQWVQDDTELAMTLLNKIEKPQLQEKLLFETNNESLQTAILQSQVDSVNTRKFLIKVQKKLSSNVVTELANETLQSWLVAEQEPIEVEQKVKMILSRLLALKDQSDYLHIQQQHCELTKQYTTITERFRCLTELKRIEIEQKYADISLRVERTIASLKPKWQAQQDALVLTQSMDKLLVDFEQYLVELTTQLTTRIADITASEADTFVQNIHLQLEQLNQLTSQLPTTNQVARRRLEQLSHRLLSSLNTLTNLTAFQQAIAHGQVLLEKFSGLTLPNDVSQIEAAEEYLKEQRREWRNTVAAYQAHIPSTLVQQWNEGLTLWQQAIHVLKKQLDGQVSRCRNKIKAVESLIHQGKFKAAMGLYQKVQKWFSVLPDKQQGQLERIFISVKEQIENLKDWQDYIAAPRKPELLKEVDVLIAHPLAIEAQSAAIKSLRYQWNSLGKIDSESDQALNEAFEIAIEKAFAPCREFYDKQQQQREQNMLAKQQVLKEIKLIGEEHNNIAELAKTLRGIQQRWKNIGEVDFKLRNELFHNYQQLINPLRDKVSAFYQENAEQKQALVAKAEKLLENDSVNEAIEQAKKLQQTWKTIEHAGKKAEAELWPAFRKANDNLFAKKAKASVLEQSQLNEQIISVQEKLTQLETRLSDAIDKGSVQASLQDKQSVFEAITALPNREHRSLEQRLQKLVELQQTKLSALEKSEKGQAYQNLFDALGVWEMDSEIPDGVAALSKQWQQCFKAPNVSVNRHDLTIKMEIVSQQASPEKDAEKRKSIQMQLMAQKLQSGDSLDLMSLLKEWIKAGSLSKSDNTLLKRIEPLFVE